MERLKHIKDSLMSCVESQMGNLRDVDTKELGEAIDMIKDVEEALYYCTIVEAMEKKDEPNANYYTEMRYPKMMPPYYDDDRDMDRRYGKMYYSERGGMNNANTSNSSSGSSSGRSSGTNYYSEREWPMEFRDEREGRSPMRRKMYMEAKEMHKDKDTSMRELESYIQELSSDITEMIKDATPEEKQILQKKIAVLATKINV